MRMPGRWIAGLALIVLVMVGGPNPAGAFEFSGGVSLGGILAGTVPRLAVSPHVGLSWRMENGFLLAVHDVCSIVPAANLGVGVYNQTSAGIGYDSEKNNFSIGPSFSMYSMSACGAALCGRVVGVAPGGHAQVNLYFMEPLGVSVSGNIDWVGGRSLVLPSAVVVTVVAGPVLRWRSR